VDLFLIRHAAAVPRSAKQADEARPLTEKGRKRFGESVEGLAALGVSFDRLFFSPWRRAVETADLLAPLLDGKRRELRELAGRPTSGLLSRLEGDRVALVGHEPWLGQLGAWLVFGTATLGTSIELKKGAVMWLSGKPRPGEMTLRAVIPPRVLRGLS
jgi:phosphohistidine phosphatase